MHGYFLSQGLLFIGGDFNCNNVLDKLNCSIVLSADKTSLVTLMSDFSCFDLWRKQNPRKISFTWSNSNNRTQASRIDRFFIAKSLFAKASCEILPCVLSDHDFVKLSALLDGVVKCESGVWHFNNSLLSDLDFKKDLKRVIANFKLRVPEVASL